MITLNVIRKLHTRYVYFFLAYTQDDIKSEISMQPPKGFGVEGDNPREWFIRLENILYGLIEPGMEWFETIKEGPDSRGFFQYWVDPCVWYREEMVLLFFVDNFQCLVPLGIK